MRIPLLLRQVWFIIIIIIFSLFPLSLWIGRPPRGRVAAGMRKQGCPCRCWLGEAEVPTPSRKRGLTKPGRGRRKREQGWMPAAADPGMKGEEKQMGRGGGGVVGGDIYS